MLGEFAFVCAGKCQINLKNGSKSVILTSAAVSSRVSSLGLPRCLVLSLLTFLLSDLSAPLRSSSTSLFFLPESATPVTSGLALVEGVPMPMPDSPNTDISGKE